MAEVQDEPLLNAPEGDVVVTMRSADGDSVNKKAFKVAGFTVLACLLVAGQIISVYFILNQRNQLGDLEQSIGKQLVQKPSGPSGYDKVSVPMNSMPVMMDDTTDVDYKKGPSPRRLQRPPAYGKMSVPMNSMPVMMDDTADQDYKKGPSPGPVQIGDEMVMSSLGEPDE